MILARIEWMTSSKKTSKIVTDSCLHANQNLLNMYANYSSFRKELFGERMSSGLEVGGGGVRG